VGDGARTVTIGSVFGICIRVPRLHRNANSNRIIWLRHVASVTARDGRLDILCFRDQRADVGERDRRALSPPTRFSGCAKHAA